MRKWLKELIDNRYLPAIRDLEDSHEGKAKAHELANWMKEQWVTHGLGTLKQQRNLMTDVRNTIKQQLGEDHFALESMNFTKAEWTEINNPIEEQVAKRNENQCLLDNPEAIVEQAIELLDSREWASVAAALAVLTGRRSSEVLATAQLDYKTPYSVTFTGALKRRGEKQPLSFEIPTLAPARQVLDALTKLREWVNTKNMSAEAVNQRYSEAVARVCDRHFSNLIPLREGRDNLYTHLFRSVYATIATYWYCPPHVADIEYKAAIQGHYQIVDEQNPELRRSLAASRHYSDYKIGDGNGNIDGRQGIRLGIEGVEVIEMFTKATKAAAKPQPATTKEPATSPPAAEPTPTIHKRQTTSLRLFKDERNRWLHVLEQLAPDGTKQEKMSVLLSWIETQLASKPTQPQQAQPEEEAQATTVQQVETQTPMPEPEAAQVQQNPQPTAQSDAIEQAWEKIGHLTEVLTRLATQFEQHAAPPVKLSAAQHKAGRSHKPKTEPVTNDSTPAVHKEQQVRPARSTANAQEKVNLAIDQIMQHNSTPGLPHDQKWAITQSILKVATKCYQGVIQRVLKQRQDEIDQHHRQHGLGAHHNNLHRRTGAAITDIVKF